MYRLYTYIFIMTLRLNNNGFTVFFENEIGAIIPGCSCYFD